jgi:hypothetical protein
MALERWTNPKPQQRTRSPRSHRVEGNRRAPRNGRVSDLPPESPQVTIFAFAFAGGFDSTRHADAAQTSSHQLIGCFFLYFSKQARALAHIIFVPGQTVLTPSTHVLPPRLSIRSAFVVTGCCSGGLRCSSAAAAAAAAAAAVLVIPFGPSNRHTKTLAPADRCAASFFDPSDAFFRHSAAEVRIHSFSFPATSVRVDSAVHNRDP